MPRATRSPRLVEFNPKRNIVPDRLDLRDRPYIPVLHAPPPPEMPPKPNLPVLNQERTNACTGFALASVVNSLLRKHRDPAAPPMSPFMLYSMARRYDEFPGAAEDSGSSLRGAMKGWYKHGVCRLDLWDRPDMPPPAAKPEDDWWLDAARRPLGAYYRVDTRSVTDMHVALHDVGVLYASALCHRGWLKGRGAGGGRDFWTIPPIVIDMENNGRLSSSGVFRTQRTDVEALTDFHIGEARKKWGLTSAEPTDIAIYAHGGLTGEETAAETAARWIPALYESRIFPIFLMWETDLWSTLRNRLADLVTGLPRPTGGLVDQLRRFWNQRLERLLAPAGSLIWGEMKQNADGISRYRESGGLVLYESGMKSPWFTKAPVRLHLIGHSAGAIVQCHVVDRLALLGWKFDSVNFMAAAATVDLFERTLLPRLKDKTVREFRSFFLADAAEEQDSTCRPILGCSRSPLYLVSESFEGGRRAPILGMEKYFGAEVVSLGLPNVKAWTAPGAATASTTHGGFDDDRLTMESIRSEERRVGKECRSRWSPYH